MTLVFPLNAGAICLNNCTSNDARMKESFQANLSGGGFQDVRYREKSHNTGDVKNSVMGDVNIRVGHDKLDINMDSKSKNNFVDASVSSTIILGDMKK
ncbi:MAG: hypothetical protein HYT75_02655 [Deltaproteobacteria bacterium]|nr:hypothetical protein [Deltaproteobacteria bacterium]